MGVQWERQRNPQERFVVEQNNEVDRAVSALTAELIKLSPLDDEHKADLSVTIESAITRLVLAIAAQPSQPLEECVEAGAT